MVPLVILIIPLSFRESADRVVSHNGKYEELIACSHEIAASTAQLVASSKVRSSLASHYITTCSLSSHYITTCLIPSLYITTCSLPSHYITTRSLRLITLQHVHYRLITFQHLCSYSECADSSGSQAIKSGYLPNI